MQGQPLRGLEIGEPQLALALAAAAVIYCLFNQFYNILIDILLQVERALDLFAGGMIACDTDTKGRGKLIVRKSHHHNTGVTSTISTEFSAAGWNKVTMEYLGSVKQLGKKKLKVILDEAKDLVQKGTGTGQEILNESMEPSGRATLCSDEEDW